MPLHTEDGFFCVLQRFRGAVRCGLGDRKVMSDFPAALMVGAVDNAGISIEAVQNRAVSAAHRMKLVMSDVLMDLTGRKMLNDIAAEKYVDDLHSLTDAEDRSVGPDKGIQKGELRGVQHRVHMLGTKIGLSKPGGMDISSARKQKLVIGRKSIGMEICTKGNGEKGQGSFIIFCGSRSTGN